MSKRVFFWPGVRWQQLQGAEFRPAEEMHSTFVLPCKHFAFRCKRYRRTDSHKLSGEYRRYTNIHQLSQNVYYYKQCQ